MKKRSMAVIMVMIIIITFILSCSEKTTGPVVTDPEVNIGTLEFRMTVWNTYQEGKSTNPYSKQTNFKEDPPVNTCEIIDIRNILYRFQVADGEIVAGEPDNLEWITIYESSEELLNSEKDFVIDLPPGSYRALKLLQSNLMYWVVTYEDNVYELPSLNNSDLEPDAQIQNIFGEDGLYELDDEANFYLYHDGEKLGTFDIIAGKTTKVTLRMNLKTLDWIDHDGDGVWSDGDSLNNWTTPEGIETMADFIVVYED